MAKDLIKAYFKALESLEQELHKKEFYYEGPFYDMRNYRYTSASDDGKPYYLKYDEASKYLEDEDFTYGVDEVRYYTELDNYALFYCHDNGEKFVLVFDKDNFVRSEEE